MAFTVSVHDRLVAGSLYRAYFSRVLGRMRRIRKEISSLPSSLPFHFQSVIAVRVDEVRGRAQIGPHSVVLNCHCVNCLFVVHN